MKAKVLYTYYNDGSGITIHRVYLEPDFEQANKDLAIIADVVSAEKNVLLEPVELFNNKTQNENE